MSFFVLIHSSPSLSLSLSLSLSHTHTPLGLGMSYRGENTGRTQRYHGHYFYSLPMIVNECLRINIASISLLGKSTYMLRSLFLWILSTKISSCFLFHLCYKNIPPAIQWNATFLFYFQHYNSRAKDSAVFWTLWYIIPTFWRKILTCNTWKFPFYKEKNIKGHRKPCC